MVKSVLRVLFGNCKTQKPRRGGIIVKMDNRTELKLRRGEILTAVNDQHRFKKRGAKTKHNI